MDLRFAGGQPTQPERDAVDGVVAAAGTLESHHEAQPGAGTMSSLERGGLLRSLLLPVLRAVQARVGWISPGALDYIGRRLETPPAEVYGVASFYAMLALAPRPPVTLHICEDIACRMSGSEKLCDEMQERFGHPVSHATKAETYEAGVAGVVASAGAAAAGEIAWVRSPCLGLCERAPAALVTTAGARPTESAIAPASAAGILSAARRAQAEGAKPAAPSRPFSLPQADRTPLELLRRVGRVNPESLQDYFADGGYKALARALSTTPAAVIGEVTASKLSGRGGAAFPTGRKWEAVAGAEERPHFLVCNADESEPGTFKDRILMEEDPFAIIEAMSIAAFATGCARGFIYIRGEYPLAAARLSGALAAARGAGLLGADVSAAVSRLAGAGTPAHGRFAFDIELRRGAGAYICGEETALFNSIEGRRGEPRSKPPFPTQKGLFQKPTLINNVETLVNVLGIMLEGGAAYAASAPANAPSSTGTRLFCLSGRVARPGIYEVPMGTTLRALLAMAGGVKGSSQLRTILLGGAAGSFVLPSDLDMPLTLESARAAGASLGSGVVMVFDDSVDMREIVFRIADFFRDESCGQCVPCRVGTVRQQEILNNLAAAANGARSTQLQLLADVGQVMRDASICGLGQTASSAVESAVKRLGLFDAGTARTA